MKRTLAAVTLAGTITFLGALPAMAANPAESADPRGNSAVAGGDRSINIGTVGARSAVAPVLSGFNDPATVTGVILWSAVGGGALVLGATSVVRVRRQARSNQA